MAGIISDTKKVSGVPQSTSRHVAMSTCFDIWLADIQKLIGFINQLTVTNTRTVTQIRHLNSVDAGIAVDTVVTPDTPTLAFNGFYIYGTKANTNELAGEETVGRSGVEARGVGPTIGRVAGIDLMMSLDQQNIPFDIIVRHVYPTTQASTPGFGVTAAEQETGGTIIGVYKNCTISSMSVPINIGTAAVADSGNISVGYISSGATP
jgi:hypothetical protein